MKNTNSAAESGSFVRKRRGYSVVQNEALFNDSLSMSVKGLYALLQPAWILRWIARRRKIK